MFLRNKNYTINFNKDSQILKYAQDSQNTKKIKYFKNIFPIFKIIKDLNYTGCKNYSKILNILIFLIDIIKKDS